MATSPTPGALLDAWERSRGGGLAARVIALLGLVHPSAVPQALLEMPLGQRNRALLALHLALVGPTAECIVRCAACRELNELSFQVRDLMLSPGVTPPEGFVVEGAEWVLRFRLPNTADFVDALNAPTPDAMRRMVVERCALSVAFSGARQPSSQGADATIPDEAIDAVSQVLTEVDPAAELLMRLTCVGCGHRFSTLLDPTHLVWEELGVCCQRLLAEVDAIARAYHWSEREILSMSPLRRSLYVNMVGA